MKEKLRRTVETKLDEEQAAFRSGRQTKDNIFIIRNVIERKIIERNDKLTFIDLRTAFDAIDKK